MGVGSTALWVLTMNIYELHCDVIVDVLAPILDVGVMTVDSIIITSVGKSFTILVYFLFHH